MTTNHLESLERIHARLTQAMDSNISISENPEIKGTKVALMHILIANIFGSARDFVEDEIKVLKEIK
jgi:hypothetical protein